MMSNCVRFFLPPYPNFFGKFYLKEDLILEEYLGEWSEARENARASGEAASLAQIGDLARRLGYPMPPP